MPVVNPNVVVNVQRPRYNVLSGATQVPSPFLSQQMARQEEPSASDLLHIPVHLTEMELVLFVFESGTDITETDLFSKITLLDGKTPWPPDTIPLGLPGQGLTQWIVRYHKEMPPFPLPCRYVFVERKRIGGPLHVSS